MKNPPEPKFNFRRSVLEIRRGGRWLKAGYALALGGSTVALVVLSLVAKLVGGASAENLHILGPQVILPIVAQALPGRPWSAIFLVAPVLLLLHIYLVFRLLDYRSVVLAAIYGAAITGVTWGSLAPIVEAPVSDWSLLASVASGAAILAVAVLMANREAPKPNYAKGHYA